MPDATIDAEIRVPLPDSHDVPSLIARLVPHPELREIDRVAVDAPVAEAHEVARGIDAAEVPFVKVLFGLRALPERLRATVTGGEVEEIHVGVEAVTRPGIGFRILGSIPGREVVVGAVGRFWRPTIEFADVPADKFAGFDEPGWSKVAWCIRSDPRESGGAWVAIELRVTATDAASWSKVRGYFRLIGRFSRAIRAAALKLVVDELGEARTDPLRLMPGDELVPVPLYRRTHSTLIEAPPGQVWPWLVQMGAGRGGFYALDVIDNGGRRSAGRVIPTLQTLAVGDPIPARVGQPGGLAVLRLFPERALVLGSPSLLPGGPKPADESRQTTWAFVLEPVGPSATLLHARVRADFTPDVATVVEAALLASAHELLEPLQLRNLKARAEAAAAV